MSTAFQPDDELLSAYIDGQLSADELRAVEEWLKRDPTARTTVEELRSISTMVQSLPRESLPAEWKTKLQQRLDATAATPRVSANHDGHASSMPAIPLGRSSRGWWYSGAAIAAAVAILCYSQFTAQEAANEVALKAPAAGAEVANRGEAEADAAVEFDATPEPSSAVPEMRAATEPMPISGATGDDLTMGEEAVARAPRPAPTSPPDLPTAPVEAPLAQTPNASATNAYLIVWADVPPETLRQREINRVLVSNGIEVEERTVDWQAAAEPVRQQIELRNNFVPNQNEVAEPRGGMGGRGGESSRYSVPERRFTPPTESTRTLADEESAEDEIENQAGIEGETILVEATADQIAACLADMEQDTGNYSTITVEPVQPALIAEQLQQFRDRQSRAALAIAPNEGGTEANSNDNLQSADDGVADQSTAQMYARGTSGFEQAAQQGIPRARRLDRPEDWYYYNTAPQDANVGYQVRTKSTATANNGKATTRIAGKQAQLDNINRLITMQNSSAQLEQQALTVNEPVQVLFVLRNSALPESATIAPAAEAAPAESP